MHDLLLGVSGLRKIRGRREVLRGVDLIVRRGEIVGVSGENGCGKTTLILILAGLLRFDRGAVSRNSAIGYAPQQLLLYDQLTPREHFRYFAAARDIADDVREERTSRLLDFFAFEAWADRRVSTLSEGTKQKTSLALALLSDPPLLLLDEPYSGLEWETYLRFWDYVGELRAAGRSTLIVSHLFHDRARLDRLLVLRDGVLEEVER